MRGRDSMSEAGTGYINLADTTTNIIARNTRQIAQPHLCMVDARLLTMLNIFALFGVAGRLFYFSPLYTEVLKGPYDEDLIRSLLPYVFLGFYLLGLLLLETVSACDGLATRRCCGMAFAPCGRLLLLTVAAALMLPITPVDHGREESICAIAILCAPHALSSCAPACPSPLIRGAVRRAVPRHAGQRAAAVPAPVVQLDRPAVRHRAHVGWASAATVDEGGPLPPLRPPGLIIQTPG